MGDIFRDVGNTSPGPAAVIDIKRTFTRKTLSSARRSSLVSAASIALSAIKQAEKPGTRIRGPLRRALEAQQRAYQEHLQQLAQYFAEVDEFELVEESPQPAGWKSLPRVVGVVTGSPLHSTPQGAPPSSSPPARVGSTSERNPPPHLAAATPGWSASSHEATPLQPLQPPSHDGAEAPAGGMITTHPHPTASPQDSRRLREARPQPCGSNGGGDGGSALRQRLQHLLASPDDGTGSSSSADSVAPAEPLPSATPGSEAAGSPPAADAVPMEKQQLACISPSLATGPGGLAAPSGADNTAQNTPSALARQFAALTTSEKASPEERLAACTPGDVLAPDVALPCDQDRPQLSPLLQLLQLAGHKDPGAPIPSMQEALGAVADLRTAVKVGEGTYGEAFKAGGMVFKVVPMEGAALVNGAAQKTASDLLAEAMIALTMSQLRNEPDAAGQRCDSVTPAFVFTKCVAVCRGPYPKALIRAWRAWDKQNGSENDPVDGAHLGREQLFAVFVMADCGRDLEAFELQSADEAKSLLLQTAMALAVAEEAVGFEHRDLHWGNVLLARAPNTTCACRLRGEDVSLQTHGLVVTLIDFTASRLQTQQGQLAYCDLAAEPEIFEGPEGEDQFDTYRRMRCATSDDWGGSYPATNALWMAYLADTLVTKKRVPGTTSAHKRALREFRKRALAAPSCGHLVADPLFKGMWQVVAQP